MRTSVHTAHRGNTFIEKKENRNEREIIFKLKQMLMVCLFSMCSRGFEGHENDKFFIYKTCEKKRSKRSQIVRMREALSAWAALLFDQNCGFESLIVRFAEGKKCFSRAESTKPPMIYRLQLSAHSPYDDDDFGALYELRKIRPDRMELDKSLLIRQLRTAKGPACPWAAQLFFKPLVLLLTHFNQTKTAALNC